jgi:UDP-N-acetylglucosamine--N-acetylmuramyl-(pentapeptide) pyrophosphoryl-undecaprenol N-acetylglucosamine transferase
VKRVILSGGGTGGHIYPALTIAHEIGELTEAEFLFVGTPKGMEARIIPQEGYAFAALPAEGLKRKITLENLRILMKTGTSLWKARSVLRRFRPDVVIGTGGYVCGPILLAAALERIPTMIQEQNVIPGVTNRILSHFVDVVALGYEDARSRFAKPGRCLWTGNPIRSDIVRADREESRKKLGIASSDFMVLTAGGSRGARTINRAMEGVHRHFRETPGICLYHVTGRGEYDRVCRDLDGVDGDGRFGAGSRLVPYQDDMPAALAAADLVIYRAGAVGLAELAARGLPSILIPYPYAAEDHQTYNARVLVAAGAAKMITDACLTADELIQDIEHMRLHPDELACMAKASAGLGHPEAGREIAETALKLADQRKEKLNGSY